MNKTRAKILYTILAVVVSWSVGSVFYGVTTVDPGILIMGAFIILNPIKNETVSPDKERIDKLEEKIAELEKGQD